MSQFALQLIRNEKKERTGKLDLGKCGLFDYWPDELFELEWLEDLTLSNHLKLWGNKSQIWPNKQNNNGNNYFDTIPDEIIKLKNLTTLNISNLFFFYARSINLDILGQMPQLQHLDLSYNQISQYGFLENLIHLQSLSLCNNNITNIDFLEKLDQLQSLDLRVNKISSITPIKSIIAKNIPVNIINEPQSKKGIHLFENPLKTPPYELIRQGNEAVMNYFKLLELEGEDFLFEAKLLILGESGAGKTTFARKIQNNNATLPGDEETTRGIEVARWKYEISFNELLASTKGNQYRDQRSLEKALKKGFRANLWDFGGQEIYHSTHRFFLSHRSLYVLIANARNQDTDFNYWMNIVEQLGGDSPLLVVINEKLGHRWRIDERGLKGRFGFFKELLEVNFGDENDIGRLERLRNSVKKYLGELPHIGDKLPKSWVEIRRNLQELNKPYISFDHYFEICQSHGMAELDPVLQLSQYFHDIGVFLHFQNDPVLKTRIFLDANWTTNTVYKLLNDQEVITNKGRFNLSDAKRIWPEVKLIHDELLKLMERFNLAYRMEGSDQFIVPEHLPEPKPYTEWEHQTDLLMLSYEFDSFMPSGLVTELIVALHRYISDQERVWRKGVVLQRDGTKAEIVEAYGGVFRIEVRVAGKNKKELLIVIMEALDQILERFAKLRYEKLVPCNCELCNNNNSKSFYKLSDLKRRLSNRRDTIDCPLNGDTPTPILLMLEETFNWTKNKSIHAILRKGNISEAIAMLEEHTNTGVRNNAIQLQVQLKSAQAEYDKGKIEYSTYQKEMNRISDAVLNLDQQYQ